jgi:hypothetical protein
LTPDNVSITNFNNSDGNYYIFNSEAFSDVPQNQAYINVTLELPTFPAELGYWSFNIQIVKNNTDNFEITQLPVFETEFLINNTISFTPELYLMRRGFVLNGTDVFGNYVEEVVSAGTVFSPGDNVSIVGQLKYSDNSIINSTDVPISGTISLIYENETISLDGKIHSLPVTEFNLIPNKTTVYNNDATYYLINFQIPSINLYGDLTIETRVEFPGNNSFTQVSNFTDITVKYLLGISDPPLDDTYYFTERLAGSVTVTPYHWNESLFSGMEQENEGNNYSRVLDIPSSELDLELITIHNGSEVNILQIQKGDYSWFWLREHLDFEVDSGNYTINFIWNNTGAGIPRIETEDDVNAFTASKPIFTYSFIVIEDFGIEDLTKDLVTSPNKTVKLRFKVVVPVTGISVPTDYSSGFVVVANTTDVTGMSAPKFSDTTSEYSVEVKVSLSAGSQNVSLTISSTELGISSALRFEINATLDDPTTSTETSAETVVEELSFTDWLFIVGAVGAFGIYIAVVLIFIRRK